MQKHAARPMRVAPQHPDIWLMSRRETRRCHFLQVLTCFDMVWPQNLVFSMRI